MNCPQCALPSQPGQKFCARCGSPLLTTFDAPPPQATPAPTYHNSTSTPPQPQSPITGPLYPTYAPYAPQPVTTPPAPARTRSRAPLFLAIGAALILIPTLVFTLLLLTRANTDQTPPRDPEIAIKEATTALASVKTLHYKSEVGFFGIANGTTGITDTTPLTITLSGDLSLPDSFTLDSNLPQLGHYITIGDTTWKRNSGGDPWTEQGTGDSSLGLVNPVAFTSYLTYAQPGSAQTISQEGQGDTLLQRIRFKVDADRMASNTPDPSTRSTLNNSKSINLDAWVGRDNRIARMTLSVEMESGAGIILRTTFSDYNKPVSIQPPE